MSRAYRIRVSQSERRIVHVEDGVQTKLELLPILSPERMGAVLGIELERRGFKVEDGRAIRREDDGVEVEVELATGETTVRIVDEKVVERSADRTVVSAKPVGEAKRKAAEAEVEGELKNRLDAAEKRLQREATEHLSAKLRDLHQELDSAVTRATAEALKQKAAELGDIEEVQEDSATGAITIRVRV